jgi:NADH-quinone oxidoreductase subunit M
MLIPMFFLIGIWGGKNRLYATTKFFLFTLAGSLLMLVGLISTYVLYFSKTGEWSSSFETLRVYFEENPIPLGIQIWMFLSFFLAFAIKVPLFPFHTWLPDAHTEAPTAGSVILAGILLKIGTYGLMRFAVPLFPQAAIELSTIICVLSVIGIIAGAVAAWRQTDVKKLVAYSSVSHLGFVTLGIFSLNEMAWNGAYIQMINHGISTGALFFLIGFIYDQKHSRDIDSFGQLAKAIPVFSVVFIIASLSSVALPGTNGFIGEFLILLGSFQSSVVSSSVAVVATTGVILSAIYMMHLVQKLCFGAVGPKSTGLSDFALKDWILYAPLVILVFVIGFFPSWILSPVEKTSSQIFKTLPNFLQ